MMTTLSNMETHMFAVEKRFQQAGTFSFMQRAARYFKMKKHKMLNFHKFLLFTFKMTNNNFQFCPTSTDQALSKGETKDMQNIKQFLIEHKHLQSIKICMCSGCDYSRIQLFSFPVTRLDLSQFQWGKTVWQMIHTVAELHYAELKRVFQALVLLLPCKKCRVNFAEEIKEFQLKQIRSSEEAKKEAFDLHNKVSMRVTETELSEEEFKTLNYREHIVIEDVLKCLCNQIKPAVDLQHISEAHIRKCNLQPEHQRTCVLANIDFLKLKLCRKYLLDLMHCLHEKTFGLPNFKTNFGELIMI